MPHNNGRWIEALRSAVRSASRPSEALRVSAAELSALFAQLERLEEENRYLRAASRFGTDAA